MTVVFPQGTGLASTRPQGVAAVRRRAGQGMMAAPGFWAAAAGQRRLLRALRCACLAVLAAAMLPALEASAQAQDTDATRSFVFGLGATAARVNAQIETTSATVEQGQYISLEFSSEEVNPANPSNIVTDNASQQDIGIYSPDGVAMMGVTFTDAQLDEGGAGIVSHFRTTCPAGDDICMQDKLMFSQAHENLGVWQLPNFDPADSATQADSFVIYVPASTPVDTVITVGFIDRGITLSGTAEPTWGGQVAISADQEAAHFEITVTASSTDTAPTFADSVAAQSWVVNAEVNLALPAATGGNLASAGGASNYSYTLEDETMLPAGLVLEGDPACESGCSITGTPTAATTAALTFTWRAHDADGNEADTDSASLTFTVEVVADEMPTFGSETIDDQTWTQGTAIAELMLPAAMGGNGALSYTLTPALPEGVTLNGAPECTGGCTLTGTPMAGQAGGEYTWRAHDADTNDADTDSAALTFMVTLDLPPGFGSETIADQAWTQGTAVDLMLPAATGGNGALEYELDPPTLPDGLTLNGAPTCTGGCTITGTPTGGDVETEYTWRVSDADANTDPTDQAELTFTATLDLAPDFGSETIDTQDWREGAEITELALPAATGGNGALSYALTPALPDGLTLNGAPTCDPGCTITGTPEVGTETMMMATTFTWRVHDSDDNPADPTSDDADSASLEFDVSVERDRPPSFGAETIADQVWVEGLAIPELTLPTATGGEGTLAYALGDMPALPAGVMLNGAPGCDPSCTLTGTLADDDTAVPAAEYTWIAADGDTNMDESDTATLTFNIEVALNAAPAFVDSAAAIEAQTWLEGQAVSLALPEAMGGNGELTYTIEPAIPGLTLDQAALTLSGMPTTAQPATTHTLTVSDADTDTVAGDAAVLTFTATVEMDAVPDFGAGTIADQAWREREAIVDLVLPAAMGGNGALSYALTPELPDGLTLQGAPACNPDCTISGTPAVGTESMLAGTTYTWQVVDADVNTADTDAATLTFSVSVQRDRVPSFGEQTIADQQWIEGLAILPLTLPTATDGDGALNYALTPVLPEGVMLDGAPGCDPACTLSGTPTDDDMAIPAAGYTWHAEDADDNETAADAATLTFNIEVVLNAAPEFGETTAADDRAVFAMNSFERGEHVLPEATGGNGALSYTLAPPAMPDGVRFDPATRTISGVPTHLEDADFNYTWRADDADSDTSDADAASFYFRIEVRFTEESKLAREDKLARVTKDALSVLAPRIAGDAVDALVTRFGDAPGAASGEGGAMATLGGRPLPLGAAAGTGGDAGQALREIGALFGVSLPFATSGTQRRAGDAHLASHPVAERTELRRGRFAGDEDGGLRRLRRSSRSTRDLLSGSSFKLRLSGAAEEEGADGGMDDGGDMGGGRTGLTGMADALGTWTFWGMGSAGGFEGTSGSGPDSVGFEADTFSAYIGADVQRDGLLMGLAVGVSESEIDLEEKDTRLVSRMDTDITSLHPYLSWAVDEHLSIYGTLGYGFGDAVLNTPGAGAELETDLEMRMVALGAQRALRSSYGVDFTLKLDGFLVDLETDGAEADTEAGLNWHEAEARASRLRVALTGSAPLRQASQDATLRLEGEVASRLDGGDGQKGLGVEVGGGLLLNNARMGVSFEVRGRLLVIHSEDDYEEWGASLAATFDPGAPGRGLHASLAPAWGDVGSASEVLYESEDAWRELRRDAAGDEGPSLLPDRLDFEVGYGAGMLGGRALLTSFSKFVLEEDSRSRLRLGARFALAEGGASDFVELFGERLHGSTGEQRYGVELKLRF